MSEHYAAREPNYEFSTNEDTAKIVDDVTAILHKCPRFRILIVGKTGVGKSTIASRVFGIPYKDIQTDIGSIWDPIMPTDVNNNIIIHDSGGFEAGDNNDSITEVNKFIVAGRSKTKLQDQIHCIWYCISCTEQRPFQIAEKTFFQKIDIGRIPVVVAFTKYDKFRQQIRGELEEEEAFGNLTRVQIQKLVEAETARRFEETLLRPLQSLVGGKAIRTERLEMKTLRTGTPAADMEQRDSQNGGVRDMIKQTYDELKSDALKCLFAAAQRYDADTKISDSLTTMMTVFWRAQGWNTLPFIPGVKAVAMNSAFHEVYEHVRKQWNIITDPPGLLDSRKMRSRFYGGCFDLSSAEKTAFQILEALDIISAASAVPTAARILIYVGGITLMFEKLFWLQMSLSQLSVLEVPLREEDIVREIDYYRISEERDMLVSHIDGKVSFVKSFNKQNCQEILDKAVQLGQSKLHRQFTEHRTVNSYAWG